MSILNLDVVCKLDRCVNQLEARVRPVAFLLNDRHIFSESLVGFLEFEFQAFNLLVLKVLGVGLLLSNLASERFNFPCHGGFDALDLLVLSLAPHLVEVR